MKRTFSILQTVFFLSIFATSVQARPAALTIVHTNDMHSHLLAGPSNLDYTPEQTDDDQTVGGWARIATVIKSVKESRDNPVLVLDAGDFLMGSLFHMLSREAAFELRLLKQMGYDAVALGNHEFDLKPDGLARILAAAEKHGQIPTILCANMMFDPDDTEDDSLKIAHDRGLIRAYTVLEKDSMRIGIFGLVGKDAAEVAPFASPVEFNDPIETATAMVDHLRNAEKVDLVICLSHSGLSEDPEHSEDQILAKEVAGIDIIVSGHTHTRLDQVLKVDSTLIVQAWDYSKQVGVLDLKLYDGLAKLSQYQTIRIDDKIPGDTQISAQIQDAKHQIEKQVLSELNLGFDQVIAQTEFKLGIDTRESNLGNLIADSIRWYINRTESGTDAGEHPVQVAFISNGVIRDPITGDKDGNVSVSDVFRAIPLGIGFDKQETMGYALVSFFITPAELKKAFEILTSIYPLKGSDYFLQFSGARMAYNPNRMIFDRVTHIEIGNEEDGYTPLDYSSENNNSIRVAADIYNATFLKVVGDFTWHILDIIPKDRHGQAIEDLKSVRVDADGSTAGIQELKEWQGVMAYIRSFADTDGDGIANIPEKYRQQLGRNVTAASWNPYHLLKGGTKVTWIAFSVLMGILVLGALSVRWIFFRN